MSKTQSNKIAYALDYSLPIRDIVSVSGDLNVKFVMVTPFSKQENYLEHKKVDRNIQPFIDDFFSSVRQGGLSYAILDVGNHIEFENIDKTTTVVIKVVLIGENAKAFIEDKKTIS